MVRIGWLGASWAIQAPPGREQLAGREENWAQVANGVDTLLRFR